jgi:5-methylcytosine-specific restriction enzyme subunit McrC
VDRSIVLREWERREAGGEPGDPLAGLGFDDPAIESAARALRDGNRLRVREARRGLALEAGAHVGVVQLGPLRVTILPKLATEDLWTILAYGLGLDVAERRCPVDMLPPEAPFADILALLLIEEANALLRRGLRRGYRAQSGWLSAPRGRFELRALAAAWPLTEAELPCTWHELVRDTLDNQVVRAGLALARRAVHTPELRRALRQAGQAWEERCHAIALDAATLSRVERERTRLTAAYEPAHRLVTLLWSGAGMPDAPDQLKGGETRIPGFLWNMATLFERFVARFLAEHLRESAGKVEAQVVLKDLYRVAQGPSALRPPRPRPDLVVRRGGRVVTVLDTKYRDLAGAGMTDGILYQLSVYGMAFAAAEEGMPVPVIALYPANAAAPQEDITIELRALGRPPIPIRARGIEWVEASRAMRDGGASERTAALAARWVRAR